MSPGNTTRLFGTDGVRGLANAELSPELALALGAASVAVLAARPRAERPLAVLGRDPRASGDLLEAAIIAGLAAAGADVLRVGVLPTPGVAYLTAQLGGDFGVVLSASHNPMPDNGIKFFDGAGFKLDDTAEIAIEARLAAPVSQRPTGAAVGRVREVPAAADRYVAHLVGTVDVPLTGLRVIVDAANGAASYVAREALHGAGASVTTIHAEPDGLNINDRCGSTNPDDLVETVRALNADAGFAHDGDADRCIGVDGDGHLVDGDAILALLAIGRQRARRLAQGIVATTVMANLGFKQAMAKHGIGVLETPVGDRHVVQAMRNAGISLGGEQSGHIVMLDLATTGDGVLTALHALAEMVRRDLPLADLAAVMQRLPQVLLNVTVPDTTAVASSIEVQAAIAAAEAELGGDGRIVLRPSGTEPLVRVMVEAPSAATAQRIANRVAESVSAAARR